jgi:hypothetical protein
MRVHKQLLTESVSGLDESVSQMVVMFTSVHG